MPMAKILNKFKWKDKRKKQPSMNFKEKHLKNEKTYIYLYREILFDLDDKIHQHICNDLKKKKNYRTF